MARSPPIPDSSHAFSSFYCRQLCPTFRLVVATWLTSKQQALARLRAYTPPPTQWYNCPLTRRAAVLILLFPDRHGELKVVLTMRAATLRNYAGQAALPGGRVATHLYTRTTGLMGSQAKPIVSTRSPSTRHGARPTKKSGSPPRTRGCRRASASSTSASCRPT